VYGHLSYQLAPAQIDERLREAASARRTARGARRSPSVSLVPAGGFALLRVVLELSRGR
jgi:hypothetical protein